MIKMEEIYEIILDKIFADSELIHQVKKYFDTESAEEMIRELKEEIKNLYLLKD